MKNVMDYKRLAVSFLLSLISAGLLTSCATTGTNTAEAPGFKFWVLRYKPPVDATAWVPDAKLSGDPEGAALNIASAMKQGDVDQWLSNWEATERPQLGKTETDAMLHDWQGLQNCQITILGRVVAEADVIVELSVSASEKPAGKIQIPLKHVKDRWYLTTLEASSEYLHWETSPNKIIDYVDPDAFQKHLDMIQGGKPKQKTDANPGSKPLARL